jgi:ribosomal protein S27AE
MYSCPMHTDYISDKPGKCPKCGMTLVEKKGAPIKKLYTCTMHSEVVVEKPEKCPKCGMTLVEKKTK